MIIELDTNLQQTKLITEYLKNEELNLSEKIKQNIMEIIEDYEDLKALEQAIEEDNGVYYTHEEIKRELGIEEDEI